MADRSAAAALLRTAAARSPCWLVGAFVFGGGGTVLGLLLPDAMARAVDATLSGRGAVAAAITLLVIALAVVVVDMGAEIAGAKVTSLGTAWLRHRLGGALLSLGADRGGLAPGDAVSRLTLDCALAGSAADPAVRLVLGMATAAGSVLALALLDWWLAVVFAVSVPVALLLARAHLRRTAGPAADYQRLAGELAARLLDAARGVRTIVATGTQEQETARVLRPLPALATAGRGMWRWQAVMAWRAALLLPGVQLAVLTAAGIGVLTGSLTPGQVLAALGYVAMGMAMVGNIPLLTTLASARASATRVLDVLHDDRPPEGTEDLPDGLGLLELRAVTAGGLHDVDLLIPAGSTLAVVGGADSPKSDLAMVAGGLLRPSDGQVLLDGADLAGLRPQALRSAVAYAFERPALLGTTIADAIRYGTNRDSGEIRAAALSAQVDDALSRLPHGYRTELTAAPLSGGEAQRVGLARALVRTPRVLVLDDAMASLDTVTEARVNTAIRTSLPGRTRIVVTNRLGTAEHADLVAWLGAGRLRGLAPHEQLWLDPDYRAVFTEARG
jgi:ATP-binding cassette subfamily B protein